MSKTVRQAADDIFQRMLSGKDETPLKQVRESIPVGSPIAPDIKDIELSDSYSNYILESAFDVKVKPKPVEKSKVKPSEKDVNALLSEFYQVVSRAKQLVQEMTTCGMIGVGKIKPLGAKKKKGVKK